MSYTIFELAYDVLKNAPKPLTYQEVWDVAVEQGLDKKLQSTGKTPWQSLGSRLYVDVRDNAGSKFVKVGKRPARFFLKSRLNEIGPDSIAKAEKDDAKKAESKAQFRERDLHPLVAYFAYTNVSFTRERAVLTKTIFHENSKKPGYNEWVYPDMVGFYIPVEDWEDHVIEINRLSDNSALRLYSFEIKKSISKGTYRESFFQAVSNSSWAHEGYLVAAEIQQDDDLLSELQRLSLSFGIGVIQLDLQDIDSSAVVFPATPNPRLDWETINKLCEQNPNFKEFLKHVRIDLQSKTLHKPEYDALLSDAPAYIAKTLGVKFAAQ